MLHANIAFVFEMVQFSSTTMIFSPNAERSVIHICWSRPFMCSLHVWLAQLLGVEYNQSAGDRIHHTATDASSNHISKIVSVRHSASLLSNFSNSENFSPAQAGVASTSAGMTHSCAVFTDSSLSCWGNNFDGQLGDGTTNAHLTPFQVISVSF